MTTAADPGRAHLPARATRHGYWWIPDESPGGLGDPEVWIDEAVLDRYGRGDVAPAVTVTDLGAGEAPGGPRTGAVVRFAGYPGLPAPAAYRLMSRVHRHGCNLGRPYYVARRNDERGSEEIMTEPAIQTPLPATETRGGEDPDWDQVRPGEPLPDRGGDDRSPRDRYVLQLPQACSHDGCGGD